MSQRHGDGSGVVATLARQVRGRRLAVVAVVPATVVAVALGTGGISAASTASQPRSTGTVLRPGEVYVPGQLLVRFAAGTTPSAASAVNSAIGATTVKSFSYLVPHLQLVQLPAGLSVTSAQLRYAEQANVLCAQPNWISRISSTTARTKRPNPAKQKTPNDPQYPQQWDWPKIDAPAAWAKTTGSRKIVVTDIDTGMDYTHEDLAANAWQNKAECNGKKGVDDDHNGYVDDCYGIDTIDGDSDPMDDNGHGTHTAGTIGAVGNNKTGVTGINWNVSVMPCKSHDSSGTGTVASIIECYQYVKMEKVKYGYDIVSTNNSYGGCTEACDYNPATYDAIKALVKPGVIMAFAAGNSGRDNDVQPNYPSNYDLPNIIAVAATDSNDGLAGFSEWGRRSVDVGAPGVNVLSTLPNNQYGQLSGTSMATPHVAGLVALLHSWQPKDDWWMLRNLIIAGGDPISSLKGKTVSGRRINPAGSMSCSGQKVFGMLAPVADTGSMTQTVEALNIDCAKPAGALTAIAVGGRSMTKLALKDNGKGADLVAGDGIYSASWSPPCKAQSYRFTFSNGKKYDVDVVACVTLGQKSGSAGSSLKVSGTGFGSGETVDIFFDDDLIDTVNADSNGQVSDTIKVPNDARKGKHTVMVSGQTSGVSAAATFTVE